MNLPVEGSLDYLAILILMVISLVIASVILTLNKIMGRKPAEVTKKKYDTYECGVEYEGDAHQQFHQRERALHLSRRSIGNRIREADRSARPGYGWM